MQTLEDGSCKYEMYLWIVMESASMIQTKMRYVMKKITVEVFNPVRIKILTMMEREMPVIMTMELG